MTIVDLLKQLNVPHAITGDKHCRPGWVQTVCPWCKGVNHLGWSLTGPTANCWQCSKRSRLLALVRLTGIGQGELKRLLAKLGGTPKRKFKGGPLTDVIGPKRNTTRFPPNTGPLLRSHKAYIKKRRFNPVQLIKNWNIQGIGPLGGRWRHRILVPITFENNIVTWQARAIGKIEPKYLACPPQWEVRPIKACVYGLDQAIMAGLKTIVVTEGVTDVWRLGVGAVCTFGVSFSLEQVKLILKSGIEKAIILRDPGRMEWRQALNLATELSNLGLDCEATSLLPGEDPGDLPDKEASHLMNELQGHSLKY